MASVTYDLTNNRYVIVTDAAPASTAYAQLVSKKANGQYSPIRGGIAIPRTAGQTLTAYDYEFPTRAPLTDYKVIWLNASMATLSTVVLPAPGLITLNKMWIKNPLNPALNTVMEIDKLELAKYTSRNSFYNIVGNPFPLASSDVNAAKSYTMEVHSASLTRAAKMDALIMAGGTWFIQFPSWSPLPELGYVVCNDPDTRMAQGASPFMHHGRFFTLPLTVVTMPSVRFGSALA